MAPRSLRIIVADDDRDTVLTMMMVLRHEGHDVWGLYRGKDVIRGVKDFNPDVVILDIGLPDLSGWGAADAVRQLFGERKPLLIAVTGVYTKGADRVLSEMAGFDHYLTKPYDISQVLKLLEPLRYPARPA